MPSNDETEDASPRLCVVDFYDFIDLTLIIPYWVDTVAPRVDDYVDFYPK